MAGPKVDVYVGAQKKQYSLPKLLLCHYSPCFNRCFNGKFIEAQTQELKLPEDKVDDFEVLLEYMLRGQISEVFEVKKNQSASVAVQRCVNFLEYADKYELGDAACTEIYEPLKKALSTKIIETLPSGSKKISNAVSEDAIEDAIETVYRVAPENSPLREPWSLKPPSQRKVWGKASRNRSQRLADSLLRCLRYFDPAWNPAQSGPIH